MKICQNAICRHDSTFHASDGCTHGWFNSSHNPTPDKCKCPKFQTTDVVQFIDAQIESMLKYPEAWGGMLSIEQMILNNLKIRDVAKSGSPHHIADEFSHFVEKKGFITKIPLAKQYENDRDPLVIKEFLDIMKEFVIKHREKD